MEFLILGALFAVFWFLSKKHPEKTKEQQVSAQPVSQTPEPEKEIGNLERLQSLVKKLKEDETPLWRIYLFLQKEFKTSTSGQDSLEVMTYIQDVQQQIEDLIVSRNEKAIELLDEDELESDEQARLLLEMNLKDESDTSYPYQILLSFYDDDEENYKRIYFQAKKCLYKPEEHKWFQKAKKRLGDVN